jgi:hypothetical protein
MKSGPALSTAALEKEKGSVNGIVIFSPRQQNLWVNSSATRKSGAFFLFGFDHDFTRTRPNFHHILARLASSFGFQAGEFGATRSSTVPGFCETALREAGED